MGKTPAESIAFDYSDLRDLLLGSRHRLHTVLKASLPAAMQVARFVVERARLNAPILEGDLRSGLFSEVRVRGTAIELDFGGTAPHTLRRHEELYTLGPVSIMQPSTPEGGVGRKFFHRVLDFHHESIADRLVVSISAAMDGVESQNRKGGG